MIFTYSKNKFSLVATVTLGIILNAFYSLPSIAQTNNLEAETINNLRVKSNTDWNFPSENESVSVADDLKELDEYNISESDLPDIRLIEHKRKWSNQLNYQRYSLEGALYDY